MSAALHENPQRMPDGVQLTCRPGKSGNKLTFPYTLENRGHAAIYAMHAMPSIVDGEASINEQHAVVILGTEGNVIIGKFAAPMPGDRQVAMPALHLAKKLTPGGRLEGLIEIELPLAEASPYFGDLPLRQYQMIDFEAVIFSIGYWSDGVDGLAAAPVDYAPDLFQVVTRKTLASARRAVQRFPTKGLQIFKRMDAFPRSLPPA